MNFDLTHERWLVPSPASSPHTNMAIICTVVIRGSGVSLKFPSFCLQGISSRFVSWICFGYYCEEKVLFLSVIYLRSPASVDLYAGRSATQNAMNNV